MVNPTECKHDYKVKQLCNDLIMVDCQLCGVHIEISRNSITAYNYMQGKTYLGLIYLSGDIHAASN